LAKEGIKSADGPYYLHLNFRPTLNLTGGLLSFPTALDGREWKKAGLDAGLR
jgi:hypothetical protein